MIAERGKSATHGICLPLCLPGPKRRSSPGVVAVTDHEADRDRRPDPTVTRLVEEIRRRRKDANLSHAQLAGQIGYSRQYISLAERATKGLPSAELVNALDSALSANGALVALRKEAAAARLARRRKLHAVPVDGGAPVTAPPRRIAHKAQTSAAILELRNALTDYGLCAPRPASPSQGDGLPTMRDLRRDVQLTFDAYQHSRFTIAASRVSTLLGEARLVVRGQTSSGCGEGFGLLALSYQAAAAVLIKAEEADLAWIAAERGLAASEKANDVAIVGSLIRSVAFSLLSTGRLESAMRLIEDGAHLLEPEIRRGGPILSAYGMLFLVGAIAAARFGDSGRTADYLQEAADAAQRLGRDGNDLWTAFGPTNVAIHGVNAAAELDDMQTVLDSVGSFAVTGVPIERRVRYLLDVARAYSLTGDRDEAVSTLIAAERMAPEQVRQHYLVKDIVRTLVRKSLGKPGIELGKLAQRVNVAAAT